MPASFETRLAEQGARALRLARDRRCPHCQNPIALLDALSLVRGAGYRYEVKITLPDGRVAFVREGDFNPQTMLWADD